MSIPQAQRTLSRPLARSAPMADAARGTDYQERALATKKRRQANGLYAKPTKAQDAAFRRYLGGRHTPLQPGDAALLAQHPWLTPAQRAAWQAQAVAAAPSEADAAGASKEGE